MTRRIAALSSPGEIRCAAIDGEELLDVAIERPGRPDGVGDLHRGRVAARIASMAGCFVALAGGAEGFLPDTEGGREIPEGTILGVRVTRAAQGGKGPRLTAQLAAPERELVGAGSPALVRRGPGAVERLAALHPDAPIVTDDPGLSASVRTALGARADIRSEAADGFVEAAIAALAAPQVDAPSGGRMHIQPTSALVAIDLDTGSATATRTGKRVAQERFNRALLPLLARQIRLRNLSGAILVDLAGLPARRRAALGPDFAAALRDDPLRPRFYGFTALGLAEIARPRIYPPLHEYFLGPHAAGLEALRQVAREVASCPARAPRVRASPPVVAALRADPVALPDLARRTGRALVLLSDPSLREAGWMLEYDPDA